MAGSALAAGGGALAVAYLATAVPLHYQAAATFQLIFALLLTLACVFYRMVKHSLNEQPAVYGLSMVALVLSVLGYVLAAIGTLLGSHKHWPEPPYTHQWWLTVMVGCLYAAIIGLTARLSADAIDRRIEEELSDLKDQATRAERLDRPLRSLHPSLPARPSV
jgi:hypothetical protein